MVLFALQIWPIIRGSASCALVVVAKLKKKQTKIQRKISLKDFQGMVLLMLHINIIISWVDILMVMHVQNFLLCYNGKQNIGWSLFNMAVRGIWQSKSMEQVISQGRVLVSRSLIWSCPRLILLKILINFNILLIILRTCGSNLKRKFEECTQ